MFLQTTEQIVKKAIDLRDAPEFNRYQLAMMEHFLSEIDETSNEYMKKATF